MGWLLLTLVNTAVIITLNFDLIHCKKQKKQQKKTNIKVNLRLSYNIDFVIDLIIYFRLVLIKYIYFKCPKEINTI